MKLLSIVKLLFEELSRGNRSLIKEDVNYDDVVADLFKIEPELASIGSREQYIEYLKGIFPDSKLKDVVYRGSSLKYDMPNDLKVGGVLVLAHTPISFNYTFEEIKKMVPRLRGRISL